MGREHMRVDVGAQLAVSLFREADEWAAKGDAANAQKALAAARSQLERAGMDSREAAEARAAERVPFTAKEEARADKDAAAAAAQQAADAQAAAERKLLVNKLAAGKATTVETQAALALLLT